MKSSPVFQEILSSYLSIISWSQEVILSLSNICFHLLRQFISTTAVVRNKKLSPRLQPFLIKMNTFTRTQSTGTYENACIYTREHVQCNERNDCMMIFFVVLSLSMSPHLAEFIWQIEVYIELKILRTWNNATNS